MNSWNYGLFWLAIFWGAIVGALTAVAFIQERCPRLATVLRWLGIGCLGASLGVAAAVALFLLLALAVGVL